MAFSLFNKPSPKAKPNASSGKPVKVEPAQISGAPDTFNPNATAILGVGADWKPTLSKIEVAENQLVLCSALENAALLYANAQLEPARKLLTAAIDQDSDAQQSTLAWLALFDLHQRCADRAAFEELSVRYSVNFERSPPPWREASRANSKKVSPVKTAALPAHYVRLNGALTLYSAPQLDNLMKVASTYPQCRLDVSALTSLEDEGCKLLCQTLQKLRRKQYPIQWQGGEKLRQLLHKGIKTGDASDEWRWLLLLELMQWQNDNASFEELAVNYAVTFEVSPPSWEVLAQEQQKMLTQAIPAAVSDEVTLDADALVCQGIMLGSTDSHIQKIRDYADGRNAIAIQMQAVERIDFVCAGALANALEIIERKQVKIKIYGLSPIIQALFVLVGVKTELFAATF